MPKKKENEIKVVNIRLVKEPSLYSTEPVNSPDEVLKAVANELKTYDREVFAILNVKTNEQPINLSICSVGTLNASLISPREVFKSSILSNAASFIAIHNHPSGSTKPSAEDKAVTKRLQKCGDLMDIKMLDHIIVAGETGEMVSFKAEGLMDMGRVRWTGKGKKMEEEKMSNNITFEIKEKIAVLNQNQSGWNKELNIVSWNEGTPKYDIREWNEDHTHMSRGLTLNEEEMKRIVGSLRERGLAIEKV